MSNSQEVLYLRLENRKRKWFEIIKRENVELKWVENGDEKNDGKYIGEIQNGKPNGQGTLTWTDLGKYIGEWKDGKFHGQGTLTSTDGEKFVGEFEDGLPIGKGTLNYPNGTKYVGKIENGKPNGMGRLTSTDGVKHVGEFKNGKRHGQGITSLPSGVTFVGEFKDDIGWNGIYYDNNENILFKRKNGEDIDEPLDELRETLSNLLKPTNKL